MKKIIITTVVTATLSISSVCFAGDKQIQIQKEQISFAQQHSIQEIRRPDIEQEREFQAQ
jgi:hypothetical protein